MATRVFDTPLTSNDQSIDRVLAAGQPVLFIFRENALSPALEETMKRLARHHAGRLLVVQIPVKDSPFAVHRYQVGQVPALVTIRQGQVLTKAEAISASDLEQHTAFLLGQGPRPQVKPTTNGNGASHDGRPRVATDVTFEQEVLRSAQPVLVDFWAPWCGPCRLVSPILDRLAYEMSGRLRVVKVNVDENPAVAQRYGVQSIPTMMLVKDGKIADRWAGALPEANLRQRVMPFLRS